jgi:hypothetical protein
VKHTISQQEHTKTRKQYALSVQEAASVNKTAGEEETADAEVSIAYSRAQVSGWGSDEAAAAPFILIVNTRQPALTMPARESQKQQLCTIYIHAFASSAER